MNHFLFKPVDSWFFRESRSMDGAGSTALESIFPPQNNTLMGAIRTHIGNTFHENNNTSWKDFTKDGDLAKIIGFANDYGDLRAQGAWLYHDDQLYFSCPMNVLEQGDGENKTTGFFSIGDAITCDVGTVKLPQLDRDKQQNPLEHAYISANGFTDVLAGKCPDVCEIVSRSEIVKKDPRLGIKRDNHSHRTEDGMLYQTNHLRLIDDWCIYLGIDGVDSSYTPNETLTRLGGEARMAEMTAIDTPNLPSKPKANDDVDVVIYLATPLPDFARNDDMPMLPNDSFVVANNEYTTWEGDILGQPIKIVSAVTDKLIRMGGWDMVNHCSLPVRSFVPAGSCWYVKSNDNHQKLIDALHGQFLTTGNDRALGYGQIFVGLAPQPNK